MQTWSGKNITQ